VIPAYVAWMLLAAASTVVACELLGVFRADIGDEITDLIEDRAVRGE
jgi:hypothetical protein